MSRTTVVTPTPTDLTPAEIANLDAGRAAAREFDIERQYRKEMAAARAERDAAQAALAELTQSRQDREAADRRQVAEAELTRCQRALRAYQDAAGAGLAELATLIAAVSVQLAEIDQADAAARVAEEAVAEQRRALGEDVPQYRANPCQRGAEARSRWAWLATLPQNGQNPAMRLFAR